ncbi:MAG: hypothetical protein PHI68_07930 [Candidatus Cloacimonetes bacterium]|nr:hypothetical protein [Candidatus Cloacimonadota bacterium]
MNKYVALILLLCPILVANAQIADTLHFNLPQYMDPVYDSYSENFLNLNSTGKGGTGLTSLGGSEQVHLNPAGLIAPKAIVHLEMNVKNQMSEIDRLNNRRYVNPIPFGTFGVAMELKPNLVTAFNYSMPKSIYYNEFELNMLQEGYLLFRQPKYYLHQLTGTIAYHRENLHLGLNLHNQLHYLDDILFLGAYNRITKTKYILMPQAGAIIDFEPFSLGLTFSPELPFKLDTPYQDYDSVIPMAAKLGARYNNGNRNFYLEADFEQTSQVNELYDDRISMSGGFEYRLRNHIYRAGLSYRPCIYTGYFLKPINNSEYQDPSLAWNQILPYGEIENSDQLLGSIGFSYKLKFGDISGAAIFDVLGNAPVGQFQLGMSVYTDILKKKELP